MSNSTNVVYGLDFGASNTVLSVFWNDKLDVIKLSESSCSLPTLLYYTQYESYMGNDAAYMMLNSIADKGRFIRNVKSALAIEGSDSTFVVDKKKPYVDIVCDYISFVKKVGDRHVGQECSEVVIGIPVNFCTVDDLNEQAKTFLKKAAWRSGFRKVSFVYEPVAAMVNNLQQFREGDIALVFDFGGSTLDFHLIEFHSRFDIRPLATHGIKLGGHDITKKMIEHKVLQHFGLGVTYNSKMLDRKNNKSNNVLVPNSLPFLLLDDDLNRSRDQGILEEIERILWDAEADIPELRFLKDCIQKKLYHHIFAAMESAKIKLSSQPQVDIDLDIANREIKEKLTQDEFNEILSFYKSDILDAFAVLMNSAQMNSDEVNKVVLIGGTTQIAYFQDLLKSYFTQAQIVETEFLFESVAMGLASIACNDRYSSLVC
ncbi:Hsp70 family protein [Candidatus Uabimicrobium amorphum]|uniref:Molecular chaperone DnaK n=1 Tax=Uabimicrobium amorphum TaxID=2596890 RepID=A0A5S9F6R0_UABAM|nr:Hsp70 family protein [Candidatus Uabimicrobium amorphum]BBM87968.1 molecular chaperone DnaK [Candidatus Uabimicrobium amorphum]